MVSSDLTILVVRALIRCACDVRDPADNSDTTSVTPRAFRLKTSRITDATVKVAEETEADVDKERITSRRVGRVLQKMRLKRDREGGTGARQWSVIRYDIERWAGRYGIALPHTPPFDVTDGGTVTRVTDGVAPSSVAVVAPPARNVTDVGDVTGVTLDLWDKES